MVDKTTKKIRSTGISNCRKTLEAQPIPNGCELVEYDGGVKGAYFVDGQLTNEAPNEN